MIWIIVLVLIFLVVIYDLVQKEHTVLRNFPLFGHARYFIERFGPELRQYLFTSNNEERPFSRDQRTWIYASAKNQQSTVGFGTDNDFENQPDYLILKQSAFPFVGKRAFDDDIYSVPCSKVFGEVHGRAKPWRPSSIVNISGMSFGALSGKAVQALNLGAYQAGAYQNTGEGSLTSYHSHGADLVFQIGTGYFGCRDSQGNFSLDKLLERIADKPVKALEIKLSQGAKPGLGGHLPAAKVTQEIADFRGVPVGIDCVSPSSHTAFNSVDTLIEWIEELADATGLPVGIKSAVGDLTFFEELAVAMKKGVGPDFIVIDGGEGGTGAAPLVYADHVSLPWQIGFSRVYRIFAQHGLRDIGFIGSGKLGLPERGVLAFALGADVLNVGREAMISIGCIQAQKCHTDKCPTGVATQNAWLQRGLDPTVKGERSARYIMAMRKAMLSLSATAGHAHPGLIRLDQIEMLNGVAQSCSALEIFGYQKEWGAPTQKETENILKLVQGN